MIIKVSSCNCTLWIPLFLIHHPHNALSYSIALLEIIFSTICSILVVKTAYAVHSSSVFHRNLNCLFLWASFSWGESLIFKIVTLFYVTGLVSSGVPEDQISFWYSDDPSIYPTINSISDIVPLCIACLFRWHYFFTMTMMLFQISIERICATYYILDYEKKKRSHIFYSQLISSNLISLPMTYIAFYNVLEFRKIFAALLFPNIIANFLFVSNIIFNHRIIKKFSYDSTSYSLAMRFQANENLKAITLIQRIMIAGFVLIICGLSSIAILVFGWLAEFNAVIIFLFEIMAHLNPLILCPLVLISLKKWVHSSQRNQKIRNDPEIDVYFKQLKNAWK
ncbi:unnamed protein product [Caenorhabditis bovis]|uniref:Serpentine Receptor, class E (Epsilon) n=1 Tax=Caenorhabditis bovis TaxID=2654633 RepID=A0A8S1ERF4_9PELO|nr:unnamed protein product [Caenorhabditis bovis]